MDNKILSIEDDKFLSSLVARKLSAAGYEMLHAANGEDALRVVKGEKPSLILLDILLPEMSGFEVLEKIKADPLTKNIPVILFSNLGQKEDIDKGLSLGAEKFIVKATVVLDDIVKEIQQVLQGKESAPSAQAGPDAQTAQPHMQTEQSPVEPQQQPGDPMPEEGSSVDPTPGQGAV